MLSCTSPLAPVDRHPQHMSLWSPAGTAVTVGNNESARAASEMPAKHKNHLFAAVIRPGVKQVSAGSYPYLAFLTLALVYV